MLDQLYENKLELWRLNYGVIILLPKVKPATNIRQFRPICLLNVIYKIITKVLTIRLTSVIHEVVSQYQTAFIPGRNILEGVVILQEVLHELKVINAKGVILKLDFEKAYDKVSWAFLEEVLQRKNFSPKWISWINSAVKGGRVCIDINGERGEYFRSFKGLRQGDPLSPLLFNLVADALSAMLTRANHTGWIQGLVPHLVDGGLTHLQYADDTVVLLHYSPENLQNVRLILTCYEAMSGMKINFEKSEIFTVGLDDEEQHRAMSALNCKLGTFPMKYLGLPVSVAKISKAQLSYVGGKIEKRLGTWQCEYLSSGGKSILLESCLSSIPLYTMGVYQLYEGNHQQMDTFRSRFFWQGTSKKRKYHMVQWDVLNKPKEFGGLGFTDTRVMNVCLLCKWIDRLERDDNSLCCSLLKKKYLGNKSIFQIKNKKGSQFWRSLLDIRDSYQKGRVIDVQSGRQTSFWHDVWLTDCPLRVYFRDLFQIAQEPNISVAKAYNGGCWNLEFRRQLYDDLGEEWLKLLQMLEGIVLNTDRDKVRWALEPSGRYTARSLYKRLTGGGVRDLQMLTIWKCNIPLKVKNFLWMAMHDRIQSAVQLKKKNWSGPIECAVCNTTETTDHILFQCPIAVFLWAFLRDSLNWPKSPTSCVEFLVEIVDNCKGINKKINLFISAGALWTIWKTRNDLVFNKKVLASPATIIFKTVMLVKSWRPLLKPKLHDKADEVFALLSARAG
jgi:hypothetical protein